MPTLQRLTTLALARAMLAGHHDTADGIAARLRTCIGDATTAPWCRPLAVRFSQSASRWRAIGFRALARLIEADGDFIHAWESPQTRPYVRHYVLRVATAQRLLPAALRRCSVPFWPHSGALAQWLDVPVSGLWRITRPAAWQRRMRLADQHYRFELCPKRRGGFRLLEVPQPWLMPLQRRVLDDLLDRIPPHRAACGFTRERSIVDHAAMHAGQVVVLKFDLQDFFAAVRASRVHALFETLGYADDVVQALTALCTVATPEAVLRRLHADGSLTWTQVQRLREPHLPQGAPSSPALANLCAFNLDLRLAALAETLGARRRARRAHRAGGRLRGQPPQDAIAVGRHAAVGVRPRRQRASEPPACRVRPAEGDPAPVRARRAVDAEPRRPRRLARLAARARRVGGAGEHGEGRPAQADVRPHRLVTLSVAKTLENDE